MFWPQGYSGLGVFDCRSDRLCWKLCFNLYSIASFDWVGVGPIMVDEIVLVILMPTVMIMIILVVIKIFLFQPFLKPSDAARLH